MTGHFRAKVVGSGHYVPEHIVTNDDIATWIPTMSGSRRVRE